MLIDIQVYNLAKNCNNLYSTFSTFMYECVCVKISEYNFIQYARK